MGHIFINSRLCHEDETEIIRHEQNHLRQYHFLDIIFIELVKAFQWFNPVVYLFNRSLRAIHEFQADQDCLSSGVPVINYQKLLLSQVFKTRAFNMTSSFSNPSLIKKRMIMMTKKRTSPIANMKLLMVIPVTGLVLLSISAFRGNTDNSENPFNTGNVNQPSPSLPSAMVKDDPVDDPNTAPFVSVEEMPVFPGGDVALLKYIGENTKYPELAKKNNIQGRVIIRFCISSKGNINQVSVIKGVDPELDAEAIRVVKTLPVFEPGKQGGKPVPVWYMVPITFNLK
jgi:TonB family protein